MTKNHYNIARVLALYKSYWAAMNKIFIYARPFVNIEITSWAGPVRDFRTSWWCWWSSWCIRNRTSEQWASEISDTNNECENSVQAPCPWSNLFISYILSEHFFFIFSKTSLYLEKMTSEFKKQGPAQTKCPKKYIIRWSLQMLWVKILTKNWSKMKYNLLTQDCLRWLHY